MLSSLSPAPADVPADAAVKDVTMATFVADVIEASKTAVVLVDFWATWCGPCKQLTPVLEKIVRESKGSVRLAKVDVDRNQPIAQQMGVQSVPSVFAFAGGRPVDGFAGALPEPQIRAWLDPLVKNAGLGGDDEKAGIESALQQAGEFLAAHDVATAHAVYLDVLDRDPACAAAYAGLARCALAENDIATARRILDGVPAELAKHKDIAPVRTALELAEQAGQGGDVAALEAVAAKNPADHQARFDLAMACYAAGRREEAVDHLLDIVRQARTWNDDAARKQLVRFFEAFGPMDPLTLSARKRLSSILFS
ncbi:MAG: thioredoxin [Alphaproteobacteria bacterium]|nr:thioredoxin [Alphaproteobacteria bacterium]